MRFSELEPKFLKIVAEDSKTWQWEDVSLAGADGVIFLCPKCFRANAGPIGTHSIVCWQPHVPQAEHLTGPGRWQLVGTSIDDLTFVAGSSSVSLQGGCAAHFFVRSGEVLDC